MDLLEESKDMFQIRVELNDEIIEVVTTNFAHFKQHLTQWRKFSKKLQKSQREIYYWHAFSLLSNESLCDTDHLKERRARCCFMVAVAMVANENFKLNISEIIGISLLLRLNGHCELVGLNRPENWDEMYRFAMEGPKQEEKTVIHYDS